MKNNNNKMKWWAWLILGLGLSATLVGITLPFILASFLWMIMAGIGVLGLIGLGCYYLCNYFGHRSVSSATKKEKKGEPKMSSSTKIYEGLESNPEMEPDDQEKSHPAQSSASPLWDSVTGFIGKRIVPVIKFFKPTYLTSDEICEFEGDLRKYKEVEVTVEKLNYMQRKEAFEKYDWHRVLGFASEYMSDEVIRKRANALFRELHTDKVGVVENSGEIIEWVKAARDALLAVPTGDSHDDEFNNRMRTHRLNMVASYERIIAKRKIIEEPARKKAAASNPSSPAPSVPSKEDEALPTENKSTPVGIPNFSPRRV